MVYYTPPEAGRQKIAPGTIFCSDDLISSTACLRSRPPR